MASNAFVLRIFAGITRPVGVFKSSSELFNKPSKEESSSVEWKAPVISVAERLRCRCVGSLSSESAVKKDRAAEGLLAQNLRAISMLNVLLPRVGKAL